jgi:hypothetical protein
MTREEVEIMAIDVKHSLAWAQEAAVAAYWTGSEFHIETMMRHLHKAVIGLGYKLVKVEDGMEGQA